MSRVDVLLVIAAALLIVLAAVISCAEAALARVSRVRVEELVKDGRRGAPRLQVVVSDAPRYLNVLLLLRVAAELTATVLVTIVLVDTLGPGWRAVAVGVGVMTVFTFVLVGVGARTIGRQNADAVGLATAGMALLLTRALGPLPRVLILIGNALTPGRGFREGPFTSEAELRDLVNLAEERQVIEADERQMIHSVFELGNTLVREIIVPRTDIVFIERTKTLRQALSLALRSGFSRIPVVGENEDDVIGIAYIKDLTRRSFDYREGQSIETVETSMRPATFVPDSKPVDVLLKEMQAQRTHMAIVIDEYGGTAGLVTIEDILEEIVGEITDEYDVAAPGVEQVDEHTVRVTARMPVEDVEELYRVELARENVETVGGLLATALGRVPIPGASATLEGLTFVAESTRGRRNRIDTVLIRTEPADGSGESLDGSREAVDA